MKILIIFTFYLLSGPVSCSDVIGYTGGGVMFYCEHDLRGKSDKYFCKETTNECVYINSTRNNTLTDRIYLHNDDSLIVMYRNLRLEDSGSYQYGQTGLWSQSLNLTVKTDPCCLGPETVTAHLGQNLTISCSYPEDFKEEHKKFYKQYGQHIYSVINIDSLRGRFFILIDTKSTVFSVNIGDVREDDGGVYFCGVETYSRPVFYFCLYKQIDLQVTATPNQTAASPTTVTYRRTSPEPRKTTSAEHFNSSSIIIIIISVSVCVVLLLIGGSALICYKCRNNRTQGSTSSPDMTLMRNINNVKEEQHQQLLHETD